MNGFVSDLNKGRTEHQLTASSLLFLCSDVISMCHSYRGTSTTCVDCHLDTCTGFSAAEDEEEEDISEESPPERPFSLFLSPASLECLADTKGLLLPPV